MLDKNGIAQRIAQEMQDGWYVNLGIGIPTLVANYIPQDIGRIQSRKWSARNGPFPYEGEEDPDLINAGKQTITTMPGASFFDSAMSFAMIRGQHVQMTVLGAMEVSENGDIANWKIPGRMVEEHGRCHGPGGFGREHHCGHDAHQQKGESKLLTNCSLPLTGVGCVRRSSQIWRSWMSRRVLSILWNERPVSASKNRRGHGRGSGVPEDVPEMLL